MKMDIKKKNAIRDKALKSLDDKQRKTAQEAWARVLKNTRETHGKKSAEEARFAMLQALADGGTVEAAEKAAMEALT